MVLILSLTRRANAWRAGLEGGRASAWALLWGQGSRHPPTIQYWGHGIWPSGAHRMMSGPNNLIAAALLGARRPPWMFLPVRLASPSRSRVNQSAMSDDTFLDFADSPQPSCTSSGGPCLEDGSELLFRRRSGGSHRGSGRP